MRGSLALVLISAAAVACSDGAPTLPTAPEPSAPTPNFTLIPWSGPVQGSAPITTGHPNQPTGMKFITNRAFNTKAKVAGDYMGSEGWDPVEVRYGRFAIASDATALWSKNNIGQFTYPAGFVGGTSPAIAQIPFQIATKQIYLSLWIKLSSNWQGHRSSTNKMFFLWINGGQRFFLSAEGSGSNQLHPQVRLQGVPDPRYRLTANVSPGAVVQRGVWQRWDLIVTANTPGQKNGQVQWWINGKKITDYRDVEYLRLGETARWNQFQWSATWGGGSDVVKSTMYLWYDHLYISGK